MRRTPGMIIFEGMDDQGDWEIMKALVPGGAVGVMAAENQDSCQGYQIRLSMDGRLCEIIALRHCEVNGSLAEAETVATLVPGKSIQRKLIDINSQDTALVRLSHVPLPPITSVVCPGCAIALHPLVLIDHFVEHLKVSAALHESPPHRLYFILGSRLQDALVAEGQPEWVEQALASTIESFLALPVPSR